MDEEATVYKAGKFFEAIYFKVTLISTKLKSFKNVDIFIMSKFFQKK